MSKHRKPKRLKLEDVEWELECLPEDEPIEGNAMASGDESVDREANQWVYDQLEAGNPWAWCCAHVKGVYEGIEEDDYLGCCSYKSEEDFKQPGGYYDDMRREVLGRLQKRIDEEWRAEKKARVDLRFAKLLQRQAARPSLKKTDWEPLRMAMAAGARALEILAKEKR